MPAQSKNILGFSKSYNLKEYEEDIISCMFYELESKNSSKFSKLLLSFNYLVDAIDGIYRTLRIIFLNERCRINIVSRFLLYFID